MSLAWGSLGSCTCITMGYFGNHSPDTSESSKRSDDKSIVSLDSRVSSRSSGDSAVLCSGKRHLSSIIGPRRDQWRSEIIADDKRKEASERSADPRRESEFCVAEISRVCQATREANRLSILASSTKIAPSILGFALREISILENSGHRSGLGAVEISESGKSAGCAKNARIADPSA